MNNNISIFIAFTAGILSFLSPCVLPLVPAYVAYLTGSKIAAFNSPKDKLLLFKKSLGFILGFSIIFILMGISVTSLGYFFLKNHVLIRKIGGILIIVFGLHIAGIFKIRLFYSEKRLLNFDKLPTTFASIFLGMAFAAGWTPCVGPILSSILIYAGSMDTIYKGIILLVFYSLGFAVPFLLTALLIEPFTKYMKNFSKYFPLVSIISGILMIGMGILMFINKINILNKYFNF